MMRLRPLLLLAFACHLPSGAHAQKTPGRFVSPDRSFEFKYPDSFITCKKDPNQPDNWMPDQSCMAYTPVCSDYSCNSKNTIACVAYPAGNSLAGMTFQAAAFSVSEQTEVKTENECSQLPEPPPRVGATKTVVINHTKFQLTETDGVATGNYVDGYAYRSFHNHKCYELGIRVAYSNAANYDPGTIREFNLEEVHRRMAVILNSFKFLR